MFINFKLPISEPSEYLQFREFAFILENDAHWRYLTFTDTGVFRNELEKALPHKIDLGAVYNHSVRTSSVTLILFYFLFSPKIASSLRILKQLKGS